MQHLGQDVKGKRKKHNYVQFRRESDNSHVNYRAGKLILTLTCMPPQKSDDINNRSAAFEARKYAGDNEPGLGK